MIHNQLMRAIEDGKAIVIDTRTVGKVTVGFITIDFTNVISKGETTSDDADGLFKRLNDRIERARAAVKERELLRHEGLI